MFVKFVRLFLQKADSDGGDEVVRSGNDGGSEVYRGKLCKAPGIHGVVDFCFPAYSTLVSTMSCKVRGT